VTLLQSLNATVNALTGTVAALPTATQFSSLSTRVAAIQVGLCLRILHRTSNAILSFFVGQRICPSAHRRLGKHIGDGCCCSGGGCLCD
jgi:hypothetical protein